MRTHLLAIAIVPLMAACDLFTSPDRVRLSAEVSAEYYSQGDDVTLTLRNEAEDPWYFVGGCNTGLQRLEAGRWVPAYEMYCRLEASGSTAIDQMVVAPLEVPAGGSLEVTYSLPLDAVLAYHRIVATFYGSPELSGRAVNRQTAHFGVLPNPAAAQSR